MSLIDEMETRVNANPETIDRWEQEIPHNPLSELLVRAMSHIDWKCFNLEFDIRTGGDGDNGEWLMYLLDTYLEEYNGIADIKKCLNDL